MCVPISVLNREWTTYTLHTARHSSQNGLVHRTAIESLHVQRIVRIAVIGRRDIHLTVIMCGIVTMHPFVIAAACIPACTDR